ncbi:unnamed protein product [Caenorhabditis brenneri]
MKAKNILDKFTILQTVHIHFLLSIPVDKKIKPLIETCGNLVLDPDGHRVNFFKVENEEDEMAQVEEEDKAQGTQEGLEEKFWRQHDIDVDEMSERNKIKDRMDAQEHF